MDNLSDVRKEVLKMKRELEQALDQVKGDSELLLRLFDDLRLLVDWKLRWDSTIERADEQCYRELNSIIERISMHVRRNNNAKSRVR